MRSVNTDEATEHPSALLEAAMLRPQEAPEAPVWIVPEINRFAAKQASRSALKGARGAAGGAVGGWGALCATDEC